MNDIPISRLCVLAVDPASRGLGFALLEGPDTLIDWGFRGTRGPQKDSQAIVYVRTLLACYRPDVLVIEAFEPTKKPHRSRRVRNLLNILEALAAKSGIPSERVSRSAVRSTFSSRNKYRIAAKLVAEFPETKPSCPPQRKIWLPEDPRINIFDALALARTYFAARAKRHDRAKAA
jgi:hypothetical protein